jgi:hypothetical protein
MIEKNTLLRKKEVIKIFFIFLIITGFGGVLASAGCNDVDGGKNYGMKGTMYTGENAQYGGGVAQTDACVSEDLLPGGYLIEYYCLPNGWGDLEYKKCPNGCKGGYCFPALADLVTLGTYSNGCLDTDGADESQYQPGGHVYDNDPLRPGPYIDSCSNTNTLSEATCGNDGKVKWETISCANGCIESACVKWSNPPHTQRKLYNEYGLYSDTTGKYYLDCYGGWGDCDGIESNGCEMDLNTNTNNCGSCGNICQIPSWGSASCSSGMCEFSCGSMWGDCDDIKSNGCETYLTTTLNCGGCGNVCQDPHGSVACREFSKGFGCYSYPCDTGWDDCNANVQGCETNLNYDSENCGSCGNKCPKYFVCEKGSCISGLSCTDGTPDRECSDIKPFYCNRGSLKESSIQCGCPDGKIPLNDGSCIKDNLEQNLHIYHGNEDHDRYDVFVISEMGEIETRRYLDASFGTGSRSLFKVKPFIGEEDRFNIYYYSIPPGDYTGRPECNWEDFGEIKNIQRFETIFNQFSWIDGKIYLTKDPSVWGHASVYNDLTARERPFIKISTTCMGNDIVAISSTVVHEFGHMFGSLEDEYIYPSAPVNYHGVGVWIGSGRKNCATEGTPEKWANIPLYNSIDFYSGCTSSHFHRSTFNSIMRNQFVFDEANWKNAFGVINEYYLTQSLNEDYSQGTCRYETLYLCDIQEGGEEILEDLKDTPAGEVITTIIGWFD